MLPLLHNTLFPADKKTYSNLISETPIDFPSEVL